MTRATQSPSTGSRLRRAARISPLPTRPITDVEAVVRRTRAPKEPDRLGRLASACVRDDNTVIGAAGIGDEPPRAIRRALADVAAGHGVGHVGVAGLRKGSFGGDSGDELVVDGVDDVVRRAGCVDGLAGGEGRARGGCRRRLRGCGRCRGCLGCGGACVRRDGRVGWGDGRCRLDRGGRCGVGWWLLCCDRSCLARGHNDRLGAVHINVFQASDSLRVGSWALLSIGREYRLRLL